MFNIDDISYAFVNQQYVFGKQFGTDSGFIDVNPYLLNGLNRFVFLTYNGQGAYRWGFQIMKNGQLIFGDIQGLEGVVSAYSNMSREYQFVYNKTISINATQCATMTSILSTGEMFD